MTMEVKNLYFKYKEESVLEDISFSLARGSLLTILGENGAGKSTLFKAILGFLTPDKGDILVDGKSLNRVDFKERARKIAYIPQSHNPTFNHSVVNVVEMSSNVRLSSFGRPKDNEREKAYGILKSLGIAELRNKGYKEISGGERQLVLIARAIMQEASILVMDEPTANLDFGNQIRVMEVCRELVGRGYSIIQSSHNPQHSIKYSDEILLLYNRRVLAKGEPLSVLTGENLKKIYKMDLEILEIDRKGKKEYIVLKG